MHILYKVIKEEGLKVEDIVEELNSYMGFSSRNNVASFKRKVVSNMIRVKEALWLCNRLPIDISVFIDGEPTITTPPLKITKPTKSRKPQTSQDRLLEIRSKKRS